LIQRPPHGFDIESIGDGFEASLKAQLPAKGTVAAESGRRVEVTALVEAARIDAGFHRVTRAPRAESFRPGPADVARLSTSCMVLSPSVALLHESWPLCDVRMAFVEQQSDDAVVLPERLPVPRAWLLARQDAKLGLLALEQQEARLLSLLQEYPLERALAQLESAASRAERARLPERCQAWLARSMRLGIWTGLAEAQK
jgi:hypothetical protein